MLENNFARVILFIPLELSSTKGASVNDAVGIAEEPIVYTKLTEAVNKELKRDWDMVETRPE